MGMVVKMADTSKSYKIEQMDAGTMKAPEEVLDREVTVVEQRANSIVVIDDDGYAKAAEITQDVKRMQKKVTEYWEPLRVSTKKAYDDVIGKKKQMLNPLQSAESILKAKMTAYIEEKEKRRIEQERLMRVAAEKEMKEKQAEVRNAMEEGNEVAAEYAAAEAEVMENVAKAGRIESQTPKAAGVSVRKNWEIINIDSSQVPVSLNGVEIRPVDKKVVMNLIKATKGTIKIPGIQYKEVANISVRS